MATNFVSRRKFIGTASIGAVGAMGLLLAACGGGGGGAAPAAAPTSAPGIGGAAAPAGGAAAAKPTTGPASGAAPAGAQQKAGSAVNWLVRTTPAENDGQEKVFEPAIKAKYPDLKVNRIVVPGKEYIPKINTMAAAKESLEIWGFGGNYFDYWARKLSEPLNQYITADKWDVDAYFQEGLMDIFKVHGKYNGLSQLTTFGQVIGYNKNLLDAAGLKPPTVDWNDASWTFDALLEMAKKLTKNYGKPDAVYGVLLDVDSMVDMAWFEGTDNFLPEHYKDGIAQKTNFNNEGNIAGLQLRHDWIYKEKVMPDPSVTQGLNQLGDPFQTGKLAMNMTGGWQFWNTSPIKEFKYGFAADPRLKTNKHHNYDDFWIMGRFSSNKENAWKVMRVLTDEKVASDYSVLSGTPPTPRKSLDAWIQNLAQRTGQSVEDLKKLLEGAIDPKISQESQDHLFLQHPKIHDTFDNEIQPLWGSADTSAAKLVPQVAKKLDEIVLGIYNQFKDSLPAD